MAFGIHIPGQGGQGINIGLGVNERGRLDWSVGLQQFGTYNNAFGAGYNRGEIGFGSRGGLYVAGDNFHTNGVTAQHNAWGANQWGSASTHTAADIFGNYSQDRYAQNVFGGAYEGHTRANGWGFTNSDYSGSVWGGPRFESHQAGNGFGTASWSGYSVPHYGHRHYHGCGGYQVNGWFGGGCFG